MDLILMLTGRYAGQFLLCKMTRLVPTFNICNLHSNLQHKHRIRARVAKKQSARNAHVAGVLDVQGDSIQVIFALDADSMFQKLEEGTKCRRINLSLLPYGQRHFAAQALFITVTILPSYQSDRTCRCVVPLRHTAFMLCPIQRFR